MFYFRFATIQIALVSIAVYLHLTDSAFSQFVSRPGWEQFAQEPDEWYQSPEGRQIIDNVLSWEAPEGGWPKNEKTSAGPFTGDKEKLSGSFDNGATTPEMRFMARAYRVTKDQRCMDAVNKGLDMILKAQYPTGGWPQSYPHDEQYHRHITFNDGAMVRLMALLQDVVSSKDFNFIGKQRLAAAQKSYQMGIQCILKCQIIVNGKLTVWCAQHDEKDYSPRKGRPYELVSLSGSESAGILRFLMSIENPSPEIIRAVKGGAEWFEASKLTGIRQIIVDGDKKIVPDKDATPLWARFYDIETNRPFFSGRDGIKKYDISEIEPERRNHYGWYGDAGIEVAGEYAKWQKKWLNETDKSATKDVKKNIEKADAIVAADGSEKFKTVQAAIDAARDDLSKPYTIFIKPGVYRELVLVPANKQFIRLVGENPETTVLTYYLNAGQLGEDGKPIGTFKTASVAINGNDFQAENITFENGWGIGFQALAISVAADRCVFRNCWFIGWQDTILINAGRQYFDRCYITGHVDFIFGAATAFFDKCHIHCRAKGYITAASTPEYKPFGFAFSNCTITGEPGTKKSYLGRPWRPYAKVAFLNTEMADTIEPAGWDNWRDQEREKTSQYAEYKSTGPGANPEARVPWAKQLSDADAENFTIDNVLKGDDGWKPK